MSTEKFLWLVEEKGISFEKVETARNVAQWNYRDSYRIKSMSASSSRGMSQLEYFAVNRGIEFPETAMAEKYI
jgi:hypothetical protein